MFKIGYSLRNEVSAIALGFNWKLILERWKQSLGIIGPGALIAVGYIDPGNWATDIAGGSLGGYSLLFVVLLSSIIAMLLQVMSARLGIATGLDLAEASRQVWPKLAWPSWIAAELAIIATDLAEVLGSALALKLLFGIPLLMGVVFTAGDVILLLTLNRSTAQFLEKLVLFLLLVVTFCFGYELILAHPSMGDLLLGYLPTSRIVQDERLLFNAVGVIGATVMPHNLYLHSHLVIKRWPELSPTQSSTLATINTTISLTGAMVLNSALVILAASVFHTSGLTEIAEITNAHQLLSPLLGSHLAPILFAIALLAAGQSATLTGTLAGQVVMSGFVKMKLSPWARRLVTRSLAIIPAILGVALFEDVGLTHLLVSSQVFLSLQLPFAIIPLLILTSDQRRMGDLVNQKWMKVFGWASTILIIIANGILIAAWRSS